jgi:hypothetical protein
VLPHRVGCTMPVAGPDEGDYDLVPIEDLAQLAVSRQIERTKPGHLAGLLGDVCMNRLLPGSDEERPVKPAPPGSSGSPSP